MHRTSISGRSSRPSHLGESERCESRTRCQWARALLSSGDVRRRSTAVGVSDPRPAGPRACFAPAVAPSCPTSSPTPRWTPPPRRDAAWTGCIAGALTCAEYEHALIVASDRHRDPRHPASTNAASAIIRASQAMEPAPRRRSQPSTQKSGTLSARLEVSVDRAGSPGAVEPPPGRCAVYGVGSANVPPKMSELPNVAGQSCSGAGAAGLWPSCSAWRQVSIAGQSAPLLVSFHTAAP
jgi:hypothetical protein